MSRFVTSSVIRTIYRRVTYTREPTAAVSPPAEKRNKPWTTGDIETKYDELVILYETQRTLISDFGDHNAKLYNEKALLDKEFEVATLDERIKELNIGETKEPDFGKHSPEEPQPAGLQELDRTHALDTEISKLRSELFELGPKFDRSEDKLQHRGQQDRSLKTVVN
ncbi:hypothetical protein EJ02DRAFT_426922 [Clathrospora elynae]|uniref:Uncharacterized protein n=1 Tax=Clathrospora elynae TaxID=706981 RepID=A0A6A5S8X1_9PLEO|nr:hypothetical protein EJ02DRAFT_426922 [Clathrospora elynae]